LHLAGNYCSVASVGVTRRVDGFADVSGGRWGAQRDGSGVVKGDECGVLATNGVVNVHLAAIGAHVVAAAVGKRGFQGDSEELSPSRAWAPL